MSNVFLLYVLKLSSKKMVKFGMWKEKDVFLIHIRDFHRGHLNKHIAEPKGIALTLQVWRALYENIQDINDDIEELATKNDVEGCSQSY